MDCSNSNSSSAYASPPFEESEYNRLRAHYLEPYPLMIAPTQSLTRRGTLRETPRKTMAKPRIRRYATTSCFARIEQLEEAEENSAIRAELFELLWSVEKYEQHCHNPHSWFQLPRVGNNSAAAAAADDDDNNDVETVPDTIDLTGSDDDGAVDLDEYLEQLQTPGTPANIAATVARAAVAAAAAVKEEEGAMGD
jgi:hypothetical protein